MVKIGFYDPEYIPDGKLTFSVIVTRYRDKWVFVRHALRTTLEVPGGHIEDGETSGEAAVRELKEETGSIDFDIGCIATYSVHEDGKDGYGRLYFADVRTMGAIPAGSEIAEVILGDDLPRNLTWYKIQPHLFRKVKMTLAERGQI